MYTELRKRGAGAALPTPEMWAANFEHARRLNAWKSFRLRLSTEWRLVRRYVRGRVLDAGCGAGEWVMLLRARGIDAVGLDFSPDIVRRLRGTYPDAQWECGDVRSMPFADGAFDTIISWGIIEHDPAGPQAALREFRRVLSAGGTMILTVPLDSPASRAASKSLFGEGEEFFQFYMTTEELRREVERAGFHVLECRSGQPGLPVVFPRAYKRFGRTAWWRLAALVRRQTPHISTR